MKVESFTALEGGPPTCATEGCDCRAVVRFAGPDPLCVMCGAREMGLSLGEFLRVYGLELGSEVSITAVADEGEPDKRKVFSGVCSSVNCDNPAMIESRFPNGGSVCLLCRFKQGGMSALEFYGQLIDCDHPLAKEWIEEAKAFELHELQAKRERRFPLLRYDPSASDEAIARAREYRPLRGRALSLSDIAEAAEGYQQCVSGSGLPISQRDWERLLLATFEIGPSPEDSWQELKRILEERYAIKATPDLPMPRFSGRLGRMPIWMQKAAWKVLKWAGPRWDRIGERRDR